MKEYLQIKSYFMAPLPRNKVALFKNAAKTLTVGKNKR